MPLFFYPPMPKLSKAEFARLVSEMPGASEEQILQEAQRREAVSPPADDRSMLGKAADTVVPMALRVGGAIAGGAAGALGGLPGVIAGGAAGSGAGELAAEAYEDWRGLREDINPTQVLTQTALGAIPILGKAGSVGKTMLSRGAQGAMLGGAATAATQLAEGEEVTLPGTLTGAALGGVLGGAGGALEARLANRAASEATTSRIPGHASAAGMEELSPSNQSITPEQLAEMAAKLHNAEGGSTHSFQRGAISGEPSFSVSTFPGRELPLEGKDVTPEQLLEYIQKNRDVLDQPDTNFGTWFNPEDGKTYLDVSKTVGNVDEALELGRKHGQKAIYDHGNFKTIDVPESGVTNAAPGVKPLAGDVPPEFHAVEEFAGTQPAGSQVAPVAAADDAPLPIPSRAQADKQKADLDAFRANASKERGEVPFARSGDGGTTALSVASIAATPFVGDEGIFDFGDESTNAAVRVALGVAGGVGAAGPALGMAAARLKPLTGQKLHATTGAGLMLAGVPQKQWVERMVQSGVPLDQIGHIRAASTKLVDKQIAKVGAQLTSAKKLTSMFQTGRGEMQWYDDTGRELKQLFGPDAEMMAGFLTATSVNATVKSNTTLAMKAYRQWKLGEEFTGYLPAVIDELNRVAKKEPLAGRKLDNFRKAILGDPDAVVIDRWMLRAFGIMDQTAATPHQYDMLERAIKELAAQNKVTPRQMQAAIWFAQKTKEEAGKARPDSPPFERLVRERLAKDHDAALKENAKFDQTRKNPPLF